MNGFKWVKDLSEFDGGFIKSHNEKSKEGYFLEVDIQYPQGLLKLDNDLPFLHKRMNIEKVEETVANLHDKKWICY